MTQHMAINDKVAKQVQNLRIKFADEVTGKPATYSYAIEMAIKKAGLWKKPKK